MAASTPTPAAVEGPPLTQQCNACLANPHRMLVRNTSLIADMLEYDRFENFQEFQSSLHMCGVCCDMVKGVLMCQPCAKCGLLYCKECLLNYCKVAYSTVMYGKILYSIEIQY